MNIRSPAIASALDIVLKRLPTMAASTQAPDCPGEGLIAGVGKFEALASAVRARPGAKAALTGLTLIKNIVLMAKTCIRRQEGLIVTDRMQRDLREVLAWQTEEVYWALLGCFRESEKDMTTRKVNLRKLNRLRARVPTGGLQCDTPSPPTGSNNTSGTSTPSTATASNGSGNPSSSSSSSSFSSSSASINEQQGNIKRTPNVARVCPGTAFVAARRPSCKVDPWAQHLVRSGAICR